MALALSPPWANAGRSDRESEFELVAHAPSTISDVGVGFFSTRPPDGGNGAIK